MFFSKKLNQFKNINHCFFSKNGGFSNGIYDSLNCGPGSNDKKESVLKNLFVVSNKIKVEEQNLILMNQTHSSKVITVNDKNKKNLKFNSDAMITKLKNVALSVLTADCVPILLYEEASQIVGCVHAGWRGALGGIVENTINEIKKISRDGIIYVAVGPCIGKKSYEVERDFYKEFIEKNNNYDEFFFPKSDKKFLFDIRSFINFKLKKLRVNYIDNIDLDTYDQKKDFFSFRRSVHLGQKDYGRCISSISLNNT